MLAEIEVGGVTISGLQGMGGIGKTALALKLVELGNAFYLLGESRHAIQFYEQQLDIVREIGDPVAKALRSATWAMPMPFWVRLAVLSSSMNNNCPSLATLATAAAKALVCGI